MTKAVQLAVACPIWAAWAVWVEWAVWVSKLTQILNIIRMQKAGMLSGLFY
jgi:hypothetical protein